MGTLIRLSSEHPRPWPRKDRTAPGTVLVIGGAGYIGSVLVRKLLARGGRVRVLDSLLYGDTPLRGIRSDPNLEVVIGDCRSIRSVVAAVRGADAVVHLAAIVGDGACQHAPRTALEVNYAATRMIAEVVQGAGVRRFVFASTCSVYGARDEFVDESSSPAPVSLYAQTKLDCERSLLDASTESFHPTILRLATVFGHSHRPRFDLVVNLLSAQAHRERRITICNGASWRPFIHVRDVADGIIRVLNAPTAVVSRAVFNLGDSRLNRTLSHLGATICAMFPGATKVEVENGDPRNYRVCFDKIVRALNFRCTLGLEDGMSEIRHALDRRFIRDYRDIRYDNSKFLETATVPAKQNDIDVKVIAAFLDAPLSKIESTGIQAAGN